ELLNLAVGIVFNNDFYRPQDRHPAHGGPVENLAHGEIENAHINNAICLGHADPLDEIADRLVWNATATQSRKSWHAWIVPAIDVTVTNQFGENALRQYCVSQVKPGELILMRLRRHIKVRNEPIVKRTMVFEFQRANGMGDFLYGIGLPMGKVVARVDLPRRAGARMRGVLNTIEHRIAKIDVTGCHVDL